jgi:protein-disulfide isomerase
MLKRLVLAALFACAPAALAAPPQKAGRPAAAKPQGDVQTVTVSAEGEYMLGSPKAKVVITEYGAPTCPYCKQWHDKVYAQLKRDYIDAGKIRFAFRELPSHNPPVDSAIFAIARCATKENYFAIIDKAFERQDEIEASNRSPEGPLPLLKALAGDFGITPDRFMGPCLDSSALKARLAAVQQLAARDKTPGTPTLLINGVMVADAAMDDYKALRGLIDKAIDGAR